MIDPDLRQPFARMKRGDRQALQLIFEQQYPVVCRTINRLVRDAALSEDLAQEVFLRLWVKKESIELSTSLPAYLRRMAINEALAHLRRKKTFHLNEADTPLPEPDLQYDAEESYMAEELAEQIREAVGELPPRCRVVFQLSRQEQLTYREIADQLGISIKTVENQMGKALAHLRSRLRSYLTFFL